MEETYNQEKYATKQVLNKNHNFALEYYLESLEKEQELKRKEVKNNNGRNNRVKHKRHQT